MQDQYNVMLRRVSRTFALSIEQLPPTLREAETLAYLLFRVSDCFEDHIALPVSRKIDLLHTWAEVLNDTLPAETLTAQIADLDSTDAEVYVAQHADAIMERVQLLPEELRQILKSRARETSLGMARWQDHGPYVEDETALDDYMHEVAGRVGYLLTELYAWYAPQIAKMKDQLMPLAKESGLALQTVNIIRGIRKDYERGWVFIPQTFLHDAGLTRETLLDPQYLDRAMQVVTRLANKADRHIESSLQYVTSFPRRYHRIRLAAMWPFLLAVKTLAISRNNPDVLLSEAKITRAQVREIIVRTKILGWSNHWVAWYYHALAR